MKRKWMLDYTYSTFRAKHINCLPAGTSGGTRKTRGAIYVKMRGRDKSPGIARIGILACD